LLSSIEIGDRLNFDLDLTFDFDPIGGVFSNCSQDKSLHVDRLYSYTLLVFPILINKVIV